MTLPRLWAAAVLVCVFAGVSLTWVYGADYWWHVRYGDLLLNTGVLPRTDPFTFTQGGQPYAYGFWFSAAMLALAQAWGGLPLVALVNAVLFTVAYGLTMRAAWTVAGGAVRLAAIAMLAGFLAGVQNWAVRPQTLSVLWFAATLLVLVRYRTGHATGRWLLAVVVVGVLWANSHGAFLLGPVLMGLVAAGCLLDRWLRRDAGVAVSPLLLAFAATLAGQALLTPEGLDRIPSVLRVAANPSVRAFALEWGATSVATEPGKVLLALSAVVTALLLWVRRLPPLWLALPAAAFLLLGWASLRSVLWAGMGTVPLLAWLLAQVHWPLAATPPGSLRGGSTLMAAGLAGLVVLVAPPVRAGLPLPPTLRAIAAPDTPIAAGEALAGVGPQRVFADMQWASYVEWRLPADRQLYIDGRFELFPVEQWEQYGTICDGLRPDLLDSGRVDALLLHPQRQAGLLAWVQRSAAWRPLYQDAYSSAWVRTP